MTHSTPKRDFRNRSQSSLSANTTHSSSFGNEGVFGKLMPDKY